jgi:flagellar biogenesis protein FliO
MEPSSVTSAYQYPLQHPNPLTSGNNKVSMFFEVFSMFWWIIALLVVFVWYMYSFARNVTKVRKMQGGG